MKGPPGGDRLDRKIGLLEQSLGCGNALLQEPATWACAQLFGEPAGERARRQIALGRKVVETEGPVQSLDCPVEQWRQGVWAAVRSRGYGVLKLATLTVWRHHHVARDPRSVGGPLVNTHQMQTQVDPRSSAGTRGHVAKVDVQRVQLDVDIGISSSQLIGHPPMGRCPSMVEQARLGQQERT